MWELEIRNTGNVVAKEKHADFSNMMDRIREIEENGVTKYQARFNYQQWVDVIKPEDIKQITIIFPKKG